MLASKQLKCQSSPSGYPSTPAAHKIQVDSLLHNLLAQMGKIVLTLLETQVEPFQTIRIQLPKLKCIPNFPFQNPGRENTPANT